MKRIKICIGLIVASIIVSGCTPEPTLKEKKEITTRIINGSYKEVYSSTMSTFQDRGYIIKNTDMNSGLINAKADNASSMGYQIFQSIMSKGGAIRDKGSEIDVGAIVTKMDNTHTKIRISMNEAQYGQSNMFSGNTKQNVKQIYDKKIFNELFNNIQVGIN